MELYEKICQSERFFLIAGPCVVENRDTTHKIAEHICNLTGKMKIPYVFKASYLKANRTSGNSFSGLGIDEGLRILEEIKKEFNVPILTDVHETKEIEAVAEVADIIQIPAFLCRQTFLIQEAALSKRIINIKKGQFMAPEDMKAACDKVSETGNSQIITTERGSTFGYHNLVVDFRSFQIMSEIGYPVVYDVTHSLQLPSAGSISGGTPKFIPMMAKAALSTGYVNGLFIETHPEPQKALSDAATMLRLELLENLLHDCVRISECIKQVK